MKDGFVNDFLICTCYKMLLSEVRIIYKRSACKMAWKSMKNGNQKIKFRV